MLALIGAKLIKPAGEVQRMSQVLSIIVNKQTINLSLPTGSLLVDVVGALKICQGQPFAVQVNQHFVPRSAYIKTRIYSKDCLDILLAAPGG